MNNPVTITFDNRKHGLNMDELVGAIKAKVCDYSTLGTSIDDDKHLYFKVIESESSYRITAYWVKSQLEDENHDSTIWDNTYFILLKSDTLKKFVMYMEDLLNEVNKYPVKYETYGQYIDSLKSNDEE